MRAALFPGQGVPGAAVLEALPAGHPILDEASETLGYDLRRRVKTGTGRGSSLLTTALAQPAIFTASMIAWLDSKERADFSHLLGHSLGEYTALVAGGAMSFAHGLCVVQVRGRVMETASRANPGGMMALLALDDQAAIAVMTRSGTVLANDNGVGQVVISGDEAALARAAQEARSLKGRAVLLDVSGPFHSPAMAQAERALRHALDHVSIRNPQIPVVSNVTARPYRAPGEIRKELVAGLTAPVRFRECLEHLWDEGVDRYTDFGPGHVVEGLARRSFDSWSRPAESAQVVGGRV